MMEDDRKRNFLRTALLEEVLAKNADLKNSKVVKCTLTAPESLDGFMATIYSLDVIARASDAESLHKLKLLVKVMKGDESFRRHSLGLILFPNEINVYGNIIPAFRELILNSKAAIDTDTWCPRVFFAEQGNFASYSDQFETILVMQNVQELGYSSGPRLDLDEAHLTLMARNIAQFHACSYAMRILNADRLKQLVDTIIPLNFIKDGEVCFKSYDIVFKYTQARLYDYLDSNPNVFTNDEARADIARLRSKYRGEPSKLMQRCIQQNDVYSVILHGDFNRNNVLFKYDGLTPVDVVMIDFQENRFGSPAVDLSFFMYMNINDESREKLWDKILRVYYDELFTCIVEITGLPADDDRLKQYSYEKIMQHLSNYFVYGAMIAVKFLPTMMATPEELAQIVHYFHNDLYSDQFGKILMQAGGESASRRITNVMMHCSRKGYLKFLTE
ncbi:uncharacterized protein LOC128742996 [Sabethes cyaneus]|uniref:uncharacterized protein LOC128742996 n=1 Tax=Sabethes cyaneus TaxID=53552 RepID=UPI00237E94DF|nr:uncharacterized protein LOC128742996 [Sabethes cyaneus]